MKFPKFGLFSKRRSRAPAVQSASPLPIDRTKRSNSGRHSKSVATTKRKRSITYLANKPQRFYPSDLFPAPLPLPAPPPPVPAPPHNIYSNQMSGVSANHGVLSGERHGDVVWLPQAHTRRPSLTLVGPQQQHTPRTSRLHRFVRSNSLPNEEFIDWPPWPANAELAGVTAPMGQQLQQYVFGAAANNRPVALNYGQPRSFGASMSAPMLVDGT